MIRNVRQKAAVAQKEPQEPESRRNNNCTENNKQ